MRTPRSLALVVALAAYVALGPVVTLFALGVLLVPRLRNRAGAWLRPSRPVVAAWTAALVGVVGLVVLLPDGWLPVPPGAGVLVTSSYVGRPAIPRPLHLAAGLPTGAAARPGPLGESPTVDTAWLGMQQCAELDVDDRARLVALCHGPGGAQLRVLDAASLRPLATKTMPAAVDGQDCDTAVVTDEDRVVVATADRRLLVLSTSDAEGGADLTIDRVVDLAGRMSDEDCLVAPGVAGGGTPWFVTRAGGVGTVGHRRTDVVDLGDEVVAPPRIAADGSAYVVTSAELVRLIHGRRGPHVLWRSAYDGGSEPVRPAAAGSPAVLLGGGLVAFTTTSGGAGPPQVVVVDGADGSRVCHTAVFGSGARVAGRLLAVGPRSLVLQSAEDAGVLAVLPGRAGSGTVIRVDVDVATGTCEVRWNVAAHAVGAPAVSLPTGLVYAATRPQSWWAADASYLTALDARTGRRAFAVRTGLGWMRASRGTVTLGPDGSAYLATPTGLVRVHDRQLTGS